MFQNAKLVTLNYGSQFWVQGVKMYLAKVNTVNFDRHMCELNRRMITLPYDYAGRVIKESITINFIEGGRPIKWVPRKKNYPHPILRKSLRLMASTYMELISNGVALGNKVPYQAVHNFGYPEKNIPQRKYHFAQPEDIKHLKEKFREHLSDG